MIANHRLNLREARKNKAPVTAEELRLDWIYGARSWRSGACESQVHCYHSWAAKQRINARQYYTLSLIHI